MQTTKALSIKQLRFKNNKVELV